ncbi:hypothetical protein D1007_17142 [Hordeum vulgare]|nr:hypothetical protein D1007_17142 [Hordeum vulgare]
MMRNNRIFQSLGIDAIASMIRKTNDVQQGTTNGVQEGSGVISDDPEYNPKEEEVEVHKTVKALKESRTKRPGVKKTASKNRKSSETSAAMPPGRVMAPPPGQTKRILEPDEPDRVTRRGAPSIDRNDVVSEEEHQLVLQPGKFTFSFTSENFEINTDSETIKYACKDVLQKSSKNRCHNIKKKYFDTVAANKVSTKCPVPDLTDGEWQALVQVWSTPRHKKEERKGEELSAIQLFKATHNSKKHGFSEPVKIVILEMQKMKDASIPEGEEAKSDAQIVEEVLKTEKLERSELQAEVMQEEMAAIKLKAEEHEAARDKELELLRKKSQEQEEKLAHLMALFGAKAL